jgi:hypothetical protein
MRNDKIIAACLVDEARGARAFGAAQRLTALLKARRRGPKFECPHLHAAWHNAQCALLGTEGGWILGQ